MSATDHGRAERVTEATSLRLRAAADAALLHAPAPQQDVAADGAACLAALVDDLGGHGRADLTWLVLTALSGAYPRADDVRRLARRAHLVDGVELTLELMDAARRLTSRSGTNDRTMRVVREGVLVDVDSVARSDFHNGIQRVARETVTRWVREHDVHLVGWTPGAGVTRELTATEHGRAAHWSGQVAPTGDDDTSATQLVVPWRSTYVLAEVPTADRCDALAALAELSGNRVVAIGYDAIPVVSADLRPLGEPNGFAAYLSVVKHARRVAAISASAADEFTGFSTMLSGQGLPGPVVVEVLLPTEVPDAPSGEPADHLVPHVLSVGRLEPHKNHAALLHAAERLWREDVEFELELIGGPGWDVTEVEASLDRLRAAGRPVRWRTGVGDAELWRAVHNASFTVFISLHEGFGLPVAESLACGTPVLTTRYGSQGQIAADGGCLTVDPRDDDDVLRGLRVMVTDAALRSRLRAEARARRRSTWDEYAAALWQEVERSAP